MTKCGSISNKHLTLFLECLCSPPSFLQDFARKASESTCLSTSSGKIAPFISKLVPRYLLKLFGTSFLPKHALFVHPKSSPAFSWCENTGAIGKRVAEQPSTSTTQGYPTSLSQAFSCTIGWLSPFYD